MLHNVAAFVDRKLRAYGRPFRVVRANSAANPLANVIGTTLAFPYRDPKGHGNADWQLMIGEGLAQPGDYLVGAGEIYIYAARPHLLPAHAIRCTQRVALLRQPAGQDTGVQSYGGVCAADSEAALGTVVDGMVTNGWPASILLGGRQGGGVNLPMSVLNGGFEIMLPVTVPVTINAGDILIDDLARRFIADTCELSALGWRMTVKEAHI